MNFVALTKTRKRGKTPVGGQALEIVAHQDYEKMRRITEYSNDAMKSLIKGFAINGDFNNLNLKPEIIAKKSWSIGYHMELQRERMRRKILKGK